ncbi:CBS domain-containing protein [Sphingorhabdus sp. IMCC26285]|jgi:CBS domain-containing protein|uniref:CBS domain-containing protein n=1 Tax=Sphingorhabdus profundilacus TaxID=2509718 RepID=A0A6I4LVT0_9SPHN|nr:CBS domain-containing protein [Sphingorhabdus profundilacus]MVZ97647.1 CBS domain-containing protein [Sphingorhabdus profundilacus]
MTISAILSGRTGDVFSAEPHESVGEVVARLAENRIGALPVIDGPAVVGIFSERDIVYGVAKHGAAFLAKTVGETMTAPAITVTSDSAILSALSLMTRRRIRHLPVVDQGRLTGFVSIGDLVKHRIEKIEAEAAAMRDYISMA